MILFAAFTLSSEVFAQEHKMEKMDPKMEKMDPKMEKPKHKKDHIMMMGGKMMMIKKVKQWRWTKICR